MSCPKCKSLHTKTIEMTEGPHYAKTVCGDCGKLLKWEPNPDRPSVLHRFFKPVGDSGGNEYDYECCFGKKHRGELLSAIVEEDPEWLEWIADNDFPKAVIELIESVV